MYDEYVLDKFTRDMLEEVCEKENLGMFDESYLTKLIQDMYNSNGLVRIELIGNNRYAVIDNILYINAIVSKVISSLVDLDYRNINKIYVVEGSNPNNFIVESCDTRSYEYLKAEDKRPNINIVLEIIGNKEYTKKKNEYLVMIYDRRYKKKGLLNTVGTIVDTEHYNISDEVAYICLPANHNPTRY